ncbi:MAG: putative metal-binding motif-containing protein [Candidatus Thiodiazotropha sp.]
MMFRKKSSTIVMLGAFALMTMHEANAFPPMESDIIDKCNGLGYDLLPAYEMGNSCNSCHDDDQAKRAYDAGNYEYFCPAPVTNTCTDADGDGYYAEGEICGTATDFDDDNAAAYPGATEDCSDGIDNDGNGLVDAADPNAVNCPVECTDSDMDGYAIDGGSCGAVDCNDNDASINPGAAEICSDGVDNNCNGLVDTADSNAVDCPLECTDSDGDGYSVEGGDCGAVDCDDTNGDVNPGALEICDDGIDNNCNGLSDVADGVCQNNDGGDDKCEVPWWRSREVRLRDYIKECLDRDREDDDDSDDEDEKDHDHDHDEDDDDEYRDKEDRDCDKQDRKSRKFRD